MTIFHRLTYPLLLSAFGFSAAMAESEHSFEQGLQVRYEHFEWREFGQNDEQLLKESGYRVGLQWDGRTRHEIPPDWSARVILYLGDVDYDGQTQVGEPVESTTGYYGGQAEGSMYVRIYVKENFSLAPFAGAGYHTWIRQLDNTGGFSDAGYDEWWTTIYGQGGLRVRWTLPNGEWYGRIGVRYPFWNHVEYDLTLPDGTNDSNLEPGEDFSYFGEVGYERNGYLVGIFAEESNYKRSQTKTYGAVDIFQPKSEQRSFGVQFGVAF